ncbi:hypothetical protein EJD97_016270 [Solanum chilense]|uniref:Uncharacterized protein n=1 Tax=Solanum chilense TaxID=4083 RepID=A0A6N2B597_SOLCI|nr:hypothetical protein EJD97_016270 [Solanum chilense]
MDVQSPWKRFTRGVPLNVENNVQCLKSNTMQEIRSKLRNDPIKFLDGGIKDKVDVAAASSKKRKGKTDVYKEHNDKIEVVVSGSLEHVKEYV